MNLSIHLHSGTQGQRLLRAALLGNAAFSALSAACLLLLPDDIIALAGFPLLHVRAILAYILLPYAAWLVSIVLTRDIKLGHARIVVGMDIAWTALSIPIGMFSPLTFGGRWLVAAVAAAVSSFAFLQWRGIQIFRGNSIEPNHASSRIGAARWGGSGGAATMNLPFLLRFTAAVIPLGVLVILAAAGWQAIQTSREQRQFVAPGKLITVGGRKVHLHCIGGVGPTVVISGGTGVLALQWSRIQRDLAAEAHVCTWDRSGFGWSDAVSDPHTAGQAADELWGALHTAGETGPFLLVGESYGGYVTRLFQARHASEVVGMVFIESAHERQWDEIPQAKALLTSAVGKLKAAVWLSRIGFLRWIARDEGHDLPADVRPALIALQSRTETVQAALAEIDGVFESAREVAGVPPLGSLALVVVSAGRSFQRFLPNGDPAELHQMNKTWMSLQDDLCHLSTNCVHLVQPDATHGIAREQPDFVAAAIRRGLSLVDAARPAVAPEALRSNNGGRLSQSREETDPTPRSLPLDVSCPDRKCPSFAHVGCVLRRRCLQTFRSLGEKLCYWPSAKTAQIPISYLKFALMGRCPHVSFG